MIILTCKSCKQSFKVDNLKNDILTIACPKCMSTIDIQSSKRVISEKTQKTTNNHYVLNFFICLVWSFFIYAALAYMHYETNLQNQYKVVDQLMHCAIESLQSIDLMQLEVFKSKSSKPIVHITETPHKTVESPDKIHEFIELDESHTSIDIDEPIEQEVNSEITAVFNALQQEPIARKVFEHLVKDTQIEYIALLDYSDRKYRVYASKTNGDVGTPALVSLANSTFTSCDTKCFHKKYELNSSKYIYVQFNQQIDYVYYSILFIIFIFLVFIEYVFICMLFKHLQRSNIQ